MKIRNISGVDREVPSLGRVVEDGAVTDISDDPVVIKSFVCQEEIWEAVDPWDDPDDDEPDPTDDEKDEV